jgi:hypothetical protein
VIVAAKSGLVGSSTRRATRATPAGIAWSLRRRPRPGDPQALLGAGQLFGAALEVVMAARVSPRRELAVEVVATQAEGAGG